MQGNIEEPYAVVAAEQIIALDGAQNFREVGGYPTRTGRRLKRRLLWRSARLDKLSDADLARIRGLGIAAIADLRRPGERASLPTHSDLAAHVTTLTWDTNGPLDESVRQRLTRSHARDHEYSEALLDLYRGLAEQHAQHLREIYQVITDRHTPILVHCAAGKDRTGIAIAILLELVGVQRAYVIADYAKTEQLLDWSSLGAAAAVGAGLSRSWIYQLAPAARALLFRSDPRYIHAALADMEQRSGSVERFAVRQLGITPRVISRLRDMLVEDPTTIRQT